MKQLNNNKMGTKFTKGTWKIDTRFDSRYSLNNGIIDIWFFDILGKEEAEANAKLIAAAPDMYKALEHIIEYWNRNRDDAAMHDALWHIIETAEKALKKATE